MVVQTDLVSRPEDESQPFWDGAARGVLMLKRCVETGKTFYYPRERSPFTGGATEWIEASGEGIVYACSFSHAPSRRTVSPMFRSSRGLCF